MTNVKPVHLKLNDDEPVSIFFIVDAAGIEAGKQVYVDYGDRQSGAVCPWLDKDPGSSDDEGYYFKSRYQKHKTSNNKKSTRLLRLAIRVLAQSVPSERPSIVCMKKKKNENRHVHFLSQARPYPGLPKKTKRQLPRMRRQASLMKKLQMHIRYQL